MPIPPLSVDEPEASATRMLRARLRDAEDHLAQYIPAVVNGGDGRLYLAAATMREGQVDLEPYPRLSPQSRLREIIDEDPTLLDFSNSAAIARIEDRLNEYGLQSLVVDEGTAICRANAVGFNIGHFQVVWLGSRRRWMVEGGTATWYNVGVEHTQVFTRKYFGGTTGWIVIPFSVLNNIEAGSPTRFSAGAMIHKGACGTGNRTYALPIAHVTPPNNQRATPRIVQVQSGSFRLEGLTWRGVFPRPF